MEECEDVSSEDINYSNSPTLVKMKPKKRSLVERELETSLTTRVTSPVTNSETTSTSRYGRARKLKSESETSDLEKSNSKIISPKFDKSPNRHVTAYKMHASNSPVKSENKLDTLDNQIENIYNENILLSRFGSAEKKHTSSAKKQPKIYIRKDLIQTKEKDETVMLIKNMFSPTKGTTKAESNEKSATKKGRSSADLLSVVKTLDFDSNKRKKKDVQEKRMSQSDLFDLEAQCQYQVGDLAWARMGTYPFWPCMVTREPISLMFIKKKLYGRLEKDIIHVTFLGDNGRRSWILETMLRKYLGLQEFETTRDQFSSEAKRKDPRLYAAFFISEKRLPYWYISVEEAETLLKEPKRIRIDALNAMIDKSKQKAATTKSKKITRTNSDVSLSESLYDSLFSEDDCKNSDSESTRSKSRNKSFDVSDVVTACLDNMAAKTGITKIQKQSHMDRWLQKAKSNTPEKSQIKPQIKSDRKSKFTSNSKNMIANEQKRYSLRHCNNDSDNEVRLLSHHTEHDYSQTALTNGHIIIDEIDLIDSGSNLSHDSFEPGSGIGVISKVETLAGREPKNNVCDSIVLGLDRNFDEESAEIEVITHEDTNIESYDIKEYTKLDQEKITTDTSSEKDTNHEDLELQREDNLNTKVCKNGLEGQNDKIIVNNFSDIANDIVMSESEANEEFNLEKDSNVNTEIMFTSVTGNDNKDEDVVMQEQEPILVLKQHSDVENNDKIFNCVQTESEGNKNIDNNALTIDNSENLSPENEKENEKICAQIISDNTINHEESVIESMDIDENIADIANEDNEGLESGLTSNESNNSVTQEELEIKNHDLNQHGFINNQESAEPKIMCSEENESFCEPDKEGLEENTEITETTEINSCTINGTQLEVNKTDNHDILQIGHVNGSLDEGNDSENNEEDEPVAKYMSSIAEINGLNCSEFLKYVEQKQDSVIDEHPELSPEEITTYLYKTWQYEESLKTDRKKLDDIEQSNLVKGLRTSSPSGKKGRKKVLRLKSHKIKQTLINFQAVSKSNNTVIGDDKLIKEKNTVSNENVMENEPDTVLNNGSEFECNIETQLDSEKTSNETTNKTISTNGDSKNYDTLSKDNEAISKVCDVNLASGSEDLNRETLSEDEMSEQVMDENLKEINQTITNKINGNDIYKTESDSDCDTSEPACSIVSTLSSEKIQKKNSYRDDLEGAESASDCEMSEAACSTITAVSSEEIQNNEDVLKRDADTVSIKSETSEVSISKRKLRTKEKIIDAKTCMDNPEFLKYLELRQDALMDENPELTQEEITNYLYNTWLYEESMKTDIKKTDDIDQANLVKGLNQEPAPVKRVRKKKEKEYPNYSASTTEDIIPKDKSKRRTERPFYKEDFSDYEDDIELFDIFKTKPKNNLKVEEPKVSSSSNLVNGDLDENPADNFDTEDVLNEEADQFDQVEEYFRQLTQPKPNLFKGLIRERVCEVCERTGNLVKCKGCCGTFHADCVKKVVEIIESPQPSRGRKKKRKNRGRKPKGLDDSNDDHSDDKSQDHNNSDEMLDNELDSHTITNADEFEAKLSAKLKEMLENPDTRYDSNSSDEELSWSDTDVGKCKVVDIIPRKKKAEVSNYDDFKCRNCEQYSTPVCFVCKSDVSPKQKVEKRQKCQVAHCNQYYHLECLEHWPQTQFNSGEPSRNSKKLNDYSEALSCPRHVCHTCVCDDPRGCKTRFCGDKLARCVRCPATYHTFTKCLPAGTQILTGSHIICPRHYEHRPGKVPCHVNTGWCFICALGGSLICCEYCPTSFHAECLNIKPPEGGYMCEDCETGCLPLYGEMVWVKLGHYRWWPGLILHPSEIPENIQAVKHYAGEFVVRFFGQYDHYWVNRGRVFPFQEGDSGKISSKNSKIDAAFAMAVEHAQRAYEIIKNSSPSNEGDSDIASSLLPPHYVKLKVNRPLGSLANRRNDEEGSLTACECDPNLSQPCGPYSHCLNRMLLTECGPTCRAGERCNNRAFEKRLYPRLEPYRTPARGWGLRTLEDIKAGQFVIEYVGELIDEEEFQRRMRRKHEVRDENYYFLTLDKERMIDAGPKGNLARFMNHSCDPNCETQKWTVLGDVRVGLFALYDIPANSELTFNYNLESAGIEKKRCMCGTKRCSGFMGAKPKQDESQAKKKAAKRTYKKRKPIELSPSTSQNKTKRGRPKNRELTEIEKDLLIIKSATNGMSSDSESSGRLNSIDSMNSLKRKRLNCDDAPSDITSPTTKRTKHDHRNYDVD
ncbi:protein PFC0760c-like [Zerene cesonia]|uniref:protein PFC0760c-like n=1 Tax=Zerene cesonia TaxID=33412 RepID=UPI0018E4EE12|nr:protein PFC0760c-like [Zerene cesonia]XP_038219409.1 protein PFC0760c-like [Zerene cesonia]XP_038219410.1 protein PFC0760c-like [Zerene cesonia]